MRGALAIAALALALTALFYGCGDPPPHVWSDDERRMIESLWLGNLPPVPPDPSNRVADDPGAVAIGHRLFFDTRFSANGEVSCASCHKPELAFTDGLPRAQAVGTTRRHTPTIVGTAHNDWFFWDGRRDSQWAQALAPMEDPAEHAGTRAQYAHLVARHYRAEWEALFGPFPDLSGVPEHAGPFAEDEGKEAWEALTDAQRDAVNRVFTGIGKTLAAYQRRIGYAPAPFDRYVEAMRAGDEAAMGEALDDSAARGLRLFVGRGACTDCHNGPLLTNGGFHNVGLPLRSGEAFDNGRTDGAIEAVRTEFHCVSAYSDAEPDDCDELQFIKTEGIELIGAMKVPSLRNVARTAPYMHAGQLATLRDVLDHYDEAPLPVLGHSDLEPLDLTAQEFADLEAFLESLTGGIDAYPALLAPPEE